MDDPFYFREGSAEGDMRMLRSFGKRQDRRETGIRTFQQAPPILARFGPEDGGKLRAKAGIMLR